MDYEQFDRLVAVLREGVASRGVGEKQSVTLTGGTLCLLLDYCAILRPLLDAVELGEVEQYRKGFEEGRRQGLVEGADRALEHVAERLDQGAFDEWNYEEVAEYLRGLKSGRRW